eukprot:scaffold70702_cov24-Tisochrysis_lutea.AAC.1
MRDVWRTIRGLTGGAASSGGGGSLPPPPPPLTGPSPLGLMARDIGLFRLPSLGEALRERRTHLPLGPQTMSVVEAVRLDGEAAFFASPEA